MADKRTHRAGIPVSEYMHKRKMARVATDPVYAERFYASRRKTTSKSFKKGSENLSDAYILGLISRDLHVSVKVLRGMDGIAEIIRAKREVLRLRRLLGTQKANR